MKHILLICKSEFLHFIRSPFKIVTLLLFILAAIYGLENGYRLFKTQQSGINIIKTEDSESVNKTLELFNSGKTGPEDYPWIDITTPFWAAWSTPSSVFKEPSPLMVFSIGQAEQYGYYKNASFYSTTFDNDLAEEIANPERLALGTLDFGFVALYLLPILIIVLLFNIGGLEYDLNFSQLIQVTQSSYKKWLLARFLFYFILLVFTFLVLMIPSTMLTQGLLTQVGSLLRLFLLLLMYIVFWFTLFFFININSKSSTNQALKMVIVWLLFCIIIPGGIHQFSSLRHPTGYMTEFIDANREEANKVWELSNDSIYNKLLALYPEIKETLHAKDSILDPDIIDNSSTILYCDLMKKATKSVESNQEQKNALIRATYWFNPVSFFQNQLNALTQTDYYAYKNFRKNIQIAIDHKAKVLLFDSWNKRAISKTTFLEYVKYYHK